MQGRREKTKKEGKEKRDAKTMTEGIVQARVQITYTLCI